MNRTLLTGALFGLGVFGQVQAADGLAEQFNLEAHGFASFGYLRTYGNNWLENSTKEGTTDLWEAAINAIARPTDRLRIGAQLFNRQTGKYSDGHVTVDWAFADYRFGDPFGLQVGRIKIPLGLFNEVQDIDAARASVFLPVVIYGLRGRDLFNSADGAKAYGLVDFHSAGSLEYSVFGGRKKMSERGGFATFMSDNGLGTRIDRIDVHAIIGGMVQWNTPLQGLALRASLVDAHGFEVDGAFPSFGSEIHLDVPNYYSGVLSALYEMEQVTLAAEYHRVRGYGDITILPSGMRFDYADTSESGYVSATWHARNWLELYVAQEMGWAEPGERGSNHIYTTVFAVNLLPIKHWSIKAEFEDNRGTLGVSTVENPHGIENHWQLLALKTTVDF